MNCVFLKYRKCVQFLKLQLMLKYIDVCFKYPASNLEQLIQWCEFGVGLSVCLTNDNRSIQKTCLQLFWQFHLVPHFAV